jgi:hypothetical protein
MRESKVEIERGGDLVHADFLSKALEIMSPEYLARTVESNPEFILGILESLPQDALTTAICQQPGLFLKLARRMPRETLRRMLDNNREIICRLLLHLESEIILEMMGFGSGSVQD